MRTGKPTGAARGLGRAGRREDPVRSMPTVLPLRAGPDPAAAENASDIADGIRRPHVQPWGTERAGYVLYSRARTPFQ